MIRNVLVTGYRGELGSDLIKELYKRGYNTICPDRSVMDLIYEKQIKEYVMNSNCDAIIHCAAYTDADKAEDERDLCMKINGEATKYIAECAKQLDVLMIYISTDYVFDGNKIGEYIETDIPNPINIYGESKYIGECFVRDTLDKYYIVRTAGVFGLKGDNFVNAMIKLSNTKHSINVVNDQINSPTYTVELCRLLVDMLESDKYGTYHATNEGYCSWYEFAKLIFELSNIDTNVKPISSTEYKSRAKRPLNSKLNKNKLNENGFNSLSFWQDALYEYLKQMAE